MDHSTDFRIENGILTKYNGPSGDVIVPEGVTGIGRGAFWGRTGLTSVVIPEGVTSIGEHAFHGCEGLTNVVIPEGVTSIGAYAFSNCKSLSNITIPESVTSIGEAAFCVCENLTHITISEGVTRIGAGAFSNCKSLSNVTFPENVTSIGEGVFYGCKNLTSIVIPKSVKTFGPEPFGSELPYGLYPCVKDLYPYFTEGSLKLYLLNESVWQTLDSDLQAEIFMMRQSKALTVKYGECVKDPDTMGRSILARLSPNSSVKECNSVAAFLTQFYHDTSNSILQQLYERLKSLKNATKALKTVESDALLWEKVSGKASKTNSSSELDKLVTKFMNEEKKTVAHLAHEMKQFYALDISDLPKVKCTDGTEAPDLVVAYLLTVHEKGQRCGYPCDVYAGYKKPGINSRATEILAFLDQQSLQNALLTLADKYLGSANLSKKRFLAYPICRYADEDTMAELTHRATKWSSLNSGNDAPSLSAFRDAALYSETRSALFFADKYHDLDRYARIRHTDADTIRGRFLSDVGLNERGEKFYDLGNQTVTAKLQKDLSFLVELPGGKTSKSLPKRGADTEKYMVADEDFSEMKKDIKRIVRNQTNALFEQFLSGETREADSWKEIYLRNPLLRLVASLLVWAQDGNSFLLTDAGAITASGSAYTIGDSDILLAHPMEMASAEVIAWQKYFTSHALKQPFAQIWEPVVDFGAVREDRYKGCGIPYYRFVNQEKHGIYVQDFDYHNDIRISFDSCSTKTERLDWRKHEINMNDCFEIEQFSVNKMNRKTNHIVAYLDRVAIYGLIRSDNAGISALLPQFTLAQIMDFIDVATKNNSTNVTALLLDYKNKNFAGLDPMTEFTLEDL